MTDTLDGLGAPAALAAADPGEMLLAVATSAAQVREAAHFAAEADVSRLDVAPRAVLSLGMGGSGIAGDVLAACGSSSTLFVAHKGYGLPGWVGAGDLVTAVSCSGSTEETMSATAEAVRRGTALLGVGALDSPLHDLVLQARGVFVPVTQGRQPRATMWALSVPLLVVGDALGLLACDAAAVEAAAVRLEDAALTCHPSRETFVNPAKTLAADLVGTLPVVWGTTPVTAAAAYRFACQLNENAKTPCVVGTLPEADHNQVVSFDGPFGSSSGPDVDPADFFRDRADESSLRQHLVLLREEGEHPQTARRAEVSAELARDRGVQVTELWAAGTSPVERLASLVGMQDFATVYLGIALGLDPTPVSTITELKQRIAL